MLDLGDLLVPLQLPLCLDSGQELEKVEVQVTVLLDKGLITRVIEVTVIV